MPCKCECADGFTEDENGICVDIDECEDVICNGNCINGHGSYICQCYTGNFEPNQASCALGYKSFGSTCVDVNECATGVHDCVNAHCDNYPGTFSCRCKTGFADTGNACVDIDECRSTTDNRCHVNAACTNLDFESDGSAGYHCVCKQGYNGDGVNCKDIDECHDGVVNEFGRRQLACDHVKHDCVNLNGSYECHCRLGWYFIAYNDNNVADCKRQKTCVETPEVCDPNATCTDLELSGAYECKCQSPYVGDGKTCMLLVSSAIDREN